MITIDDIKTARMQGVIFLDGQGFYERHYRCVEFPALVKVIRGPRGKRRHHWPEGSAGALAADRVTVTYYVHGHPLPHNSDLVTIAAALNAPVPEGAPVYVDPIAHTKTERLGL